MENNKKKIIISIILIIILIGFVVGITYAAATWTRITSDNTVNTGSISMSYVEPTNALILENALPMSDEEGKSQTNYFEFTVSTHATTNASDNTGITIPYEINISDIELTNEELAKYFVKLNLTIVEGNTETEALQPITMTNLNLSALRDGATKVYETADTHKNGSTTKTTTYRLRAWLDKNYVVENKVETKYQYKFRVNVNSAVNAVGIDTNTTTDKKYLSKAILDQGIVSSGDGLYVSTETNTSQPTYYYHGAVENNYVSFANLTWRVVRINEDGTIKIICNTANWGPFNSTQDLLKYMYYSESAVEGGAKNVADKWYTNKLANYDSYIATTNFCESAKVTKDETYITGEAIMEVASNYTPDFKCPLDGNGHQYVNSKIGFITVDEALLAGIGFDSENANTNTYLSKNTYWWTMSPAGFNGNNARIWLLRPNGYFIDMNPTSGNNMHYVISLNANTLVTGTGESGNMWIVQ